MYFSEHIVTDGGTSAEKANKHLFVSSQNYTRDTVHDQRRTLLVLYRNPKGTPPTFSWLVNIGPTPSERC